MIAFLFLVIDLSNFSPLLGFQTEKVFNYRARFCNLSCLCVDLIGYQLMEESV